MSLKKILIVTLFVLAVLGLGFALYWVFFRSVPPANQNNNNISGGNLPNIATGTPQTTNGNTNTIPILPGQQFDNSKVSKVASGGLTEVNKVIADSVVGLVKSTSGINFYDQTKQQFFKINANGQIELLSDKLFYGVSNVTWSNSGEKAIIEYPDGANVLYNFKQEKQVTLPKEMEEFSFSKQGDAITAKWFSDASQNDSDNNWIISAKDDGSGLALVEKLGDKSYSTQIVYSPDNQVAALHEKSIDNLRQMVYPIGLNGESLKAFEVAGSGFVSKWSPAGNSLVYSVYNTQTDYLPNLWVTSGKTGEMGDLKVSLSINTWPDKCTYTDESTMFCAVPQGLPRGAGIYPEISYQYPDNFYRVDLNSGVKTLLASPVGSEGAYSAYNLSVSADGTMLYFMDRNSGTLQGIRLK
ncbi:MAG: hypothetical protein WCV69_01690 [Patescibacteria group bacterium]|jgi:hypothetical protein